MRYLNTHRAGDMIGEAVTIAQRLVMAAIVLGIAFGGNVSAETALAVGDRVYVCYEMGAFDRLVTKTARHWDGCEGVVELMDGANVGVRRTYPICVGYETSDGELNIVPANSVEVEQVACWRR